MSKINQLKQLWRNLKFLQENKATFFHGNEKLVKDERYDFLYRKAWLNGVKMSYYASEQDLMYLKTAEDVSIVTNYKYFVFLEIFVDRVYALPVQFRKDFYVFDVGMNRGYASLFFASNPLCKKVYGFELDDSGYTWAMENFALNPHLADKIEPHHFGLWNEDKEVDISVCDSDHSTTISTLIPQYEEIKKIKATQRTGIKKARVRKSSDVFSSVFDSLSPDVDKILKIDIEGAEYVVFEDLYTHNLLQQFDLIIGECHDGLAGLEKYLDDFVCLSKSSDTGLFLTFCFINKRKTGK